MTPLPLAAMDPELAPAGDSDALLRTVARPTCPLCGARGRGLHDSVPDHYFGVRGAWNLRCCDEPGCGLVWQDPMVVAEDLPKAYQNYYTTLGTGTQAAPERAAFDPMFYRLERLATRVLGLGPERERLAQAYLDRERPGTLLDVGCGDGTFAAEMKRRGWNVRGTDFDPAAAARARSDHDISVDVGDLVQLAYEASSLDVVTARHVIEHVYDPVEFAAECWRLLKPGGQLVLVTPNVGSLGHRHFGPRWRGLEQPRHLHLFDPRSMRALLERAGIHDAKVFSTAQGATYGLRGSYATSRGVLRRCIDYSAIWWLQVAETLLERNGRDVGEELVVVARKPPTDVEPAATVASRAER